MKKHLKALVIDDEPQVSNFIANVLSSVGWSVSQADSAEKAFEMLPEEEWLVIFCDVMLGEINGYEVLRRFSEMQSAARFVMITGQGSAAGALDATAFGAYDYLLKPFTVDEILNVANAVREYSRQNRSQSRAADAEENEPVYTSEIPLIGKSPEFVECLKMVGRVAPTNLPVFIVGESGTGKEIVARAIHLRSRRAEKPFVAVNCGAIPVELIESELFGHAKGSFTGAERARLGLWEEADGGTIFLDEITETSQIFQVKLLRALQQGEIRRVGANQNIKVDVRVIAATNRDIEEEVREGRFRQDLMYRLNAVTIQLPPLRRRIEDIPLLIEYFAAAARPTDAASSVNFSPEAMKLLQNYYWHGNVRELENAVLRAVSLSDNIVYPEHLPVNIQQKNDRQIVDSSSQAVNTSEISIPVSSGGGAQWLSMSELEAEYAAQVLAHTGGNKQAAARILGIDRKTLTRILNRSDSKTSP